MLRYPFESAEARQLNKDIFETLYHAALEASCEIAKVDGPYETYEGSPVSQGILQYDMWNVKPSDRWNWDRLKENIKQHGVRNSLLVAPMPTASTSQILGNNECFEPYTSNIYQRRVLSGEFQVVVSEFFHTVTVALATRGHEVTSCIDTSMFLLDKLLEPPFVERLDGDGIVERVDEEPDHCCERFDPESPWPGRGVQEAVQDHLGDPPESTAGHGRRPCTLYRSVAIAQHFYVRPQRK